MDNMICCPSVKNPSFLTISCFIDRIVSKYWMLHIQANRILEKGTKITWNSRNGCVNSIIGITRSGCMRVQHRGQLLMLFWSKRERTIMRYNFRLALITINHDLISFGNSSFLLVTSRKSNKLVTFLHDVTKLSTVAAHKFSFSNISFEILAIIVVWRRTLIEGLVLNNKCSWINWRGAFKS